MRSGCLFLSDICSEPWLPFTVETCHQGPVNLLPLPSRNASLDMYQLNKYVAYERRRFEAAGRSH